MTRRNPLDLIARTRQLKRRRWRARIVIRSARHPSSASPLQREFKQILGRGTRIHEETQKYYFTLLDFRGASRHFADPDFDGEPVQIYEPDDDDPIAPPVDDDAELEEGEIVVDPGNDISIQPDDEPASLKIYVNGVLVSIIGERVRYYDADGTLVTESLKDYSKASSGPMNYWRCATNSMQP